jgi:hypothetical protein
MNEMTEAVQPLEDVRVRQRRILFVERITGDDVVLMAFKDPAPRYAVLAETAAVALGEVASGVDADRLEVTLLPPSPPSSAAPQMTAIEMPSLGKSNGPGASPPVLVKIRGVELMWLPGRAVLQCDPEQTEPLLSALAEFAYYEGELRRIETEIVGAWAELEQDKGLAFAVTKADLKRSEAVGGRMSRALERRIKMARIEPHLYEPDAGLPAAGRKLGEELREKARIESRLETVDAQVEVFENIYEMSGQRMGEFRAAAEEHVLEWIIIVLLAGELLLLLVQAIWKFAG